MEPPSLGHRKSEARRALRRRGKCAYVVPRRGNRTRFVGPYSEGARGAQARGRSWERGEGDRGGDLFPRAVPRRKGDLEGAGAGGPNLIAEEVPPESPEPVAGLPAVRSLLEVELAERRRRMLEEAVLELERLT